MARLISLCFVVLLFHGCLAQTRQNKQQQQQQNECQWQQCQQPNECQFNKLTALEPDNRVQFEAGTVESWSPNHDQFQCAGVAVIKRTIEPNGLLLPSYSNAPQLVYIAQGRGLTGVLFPGCAETFQESQTQQGQGSWLQDQHQKVRPFRQGDVIALPAGVAHWCYNEGNERVVAITVLDMANVANQLDTNWPRHFFLAGNPQEVFQEQQGLQGQSSHKESQGSSCNNIFCGIEARLLAEAFNVDEKVARRLQSENDNRGNIVKVREGGLRLVRPPTRMQEEQLQGPSCRQPFRGGNCSHNGLEETYCTMTIVENIGDPQRADVFTPDAGRVSTVNSHNLPILRLLRLSAERGVLYRDGILLPRWNKNCHSIIYVLRGQARVQIVDHNGDTMFNGVVRQNQVLTVPQNFVVVKRAEKDGFEWISFKTNDHAMISTLAGKTSALRAMPVEVVANAFQVSLEEARRIKFNRQETTLASAKSQLSGGFSQA